MCQEGEKRNLFLLATKHCNWSFNVCISDFPYIELRETSHSHTHIQVNQRTTKNWSKLFHKTFFTLSAFFVRSSSSSLFLVYETRSFSLEMATSNAKRSQKEEGQKRNYKSKKIHMCTRATTAHNEIYSTISLHPTKNQNNANTQHSWIAKWILV